MQVTTLAIPDIKVVRPKIFRDDRGFFSETYNADALGKSGFDAIFVQDNHAMSTEIGVVRGLHFQIGPNAQGKLVRVVKGAILDVAVDIRAGSPTYGQHIARELSADNWEQLWVPVGFAHGYCTLQENTEVIYKVTAPYDRENERGIQFDDPALAIPWPFPRERAVLSAKDRENKPLADHPTYFSYTPGDGEPS